MATQITPIEEVRSTLIRMENELRSVLPSYISPEKFQQVAVTALQLNPALLTLDRQSLYSACLNCASDGLVPNGREAALVPAKDKVSYRPMVGGILKLIRNSGELSSVDAITVYEKDQYESFTDEHGPHFKHIKARGDRGKPILTYGYARTKDGGVYHEEISQEELMKIKAKANDKYSAWQGDFEDEMKRKTVLKRLSKRLPKSTDLERVIDRDNEIYDMDVPEHKPAETSSRLAEAVAPQAEEAQVVPQPVPAAPAPTAWEQEDIAKANGNKIASGLIEKLDIKQSPPEAPKKWIKYGCKIGDTWYATFSETIYKQMAHFADQRVLVNLQYTSETKGDKTFHNVVAVEAQVAGIDVPI